MKRCSPRVFTSARVSFACGGGSCGYSAVHLQLRFMNVNRSVQTRMNSDYQQSLQAKTDYDMDKELWSKTMKFASMDCIMDPDLSPIKYTSWKGLKKAWKRWLTMKKLRERRPDFNTDNLKKLFIELKTIWHGRPSEQATRRLQFLTTHTEVSRIMAIMNHSLDAQLKQGSWKALKMSAAHSEYEIIIDNFVLVNCYQAQMSQEDWLQITMRCEYRERHQAKDEYASVVEYPVFEVRLGDGVITGNTAPFIVVGILKKDGTRYGKDAQDAASMKKQFDKQKGWFS
jgi:hypothetical protein